MFNRQAARQAEAIFRARSRDFATRVRARRDLDFVWHAL